MHKQKAESSNGHKDSTDRLLKASEAAELLSVSVRSVWSLRSCGDLPAIQIGRATRFRLTDVERIIRNGARS